MNNPNDRAGIEGGGPQKPAPRNSEPPQSAHRDQAAGAGPAVRPAQSPLPDSGDDAVLRAYPAQPAGARQLPQTIAARPIKTGPNGQPIPVRPIAQPPATAPATSPALRPGGAVMPPAGGAALRPTAPAARPRGRHWALFASFLLIVLLPTAFWAWYLWTRATDQYVSTVGFSVHKEEMTPSIDLLGGLGALAGGSSGSSDTDIIYEYIRSQDMVERVDAELDLRHIFSNHWPNDFIFAFNPKGHIEELTKYWDRQVKVLYDTSSNLITLKVSAFDPKDAQAIAQAVFKESSDKINELSAISRDDSLRLAAAELEKTRADLTESRQAITNFRMRSQIVDPQADLASQMGVLSGLQAQLAEALVSHDLLLDNARPTDNRVTQSQQKLNALRKLIESERAKFSADGSGPTGESYSHLMAEYEKLAVDREFAEGAYRSARIAYEGAMAEAQRKTRYLAAHIEPKIAQSSTEPNRAWLLLMVAGFLLTGWSILVLIYYSIRDRA